AGPSLGHRPGGRRGSLCTGPDTGPAMLPHITHDAGRPAPAEPASHPDPASAGPASTTRAAHRTDRRRTLPAQPRSTALAGACTGIGSHLGRGLCHAVAHTTRHRHAHHRSARPRPAGLDRCPPAAVAAPGPDQRRRTDLRGAAQCLSGRHRSRATPPCRPHDADATEPGHRRGRAPAAHRLPARQRRRRRTLTMSYILDALQKAAAERQRGQVPTLVPPTPWETVSSAAPRRRLGPAGFALLGMGLAAVLLGIWWKADRAPAATTSQATTTAHPPATLPADA